MTDQTIFPIWHPSLTEPPFNGIAGQVPDLMEDTNSLVERFLDTNHSFAESSLAKANAAILALSTAAMPPALPDPPLPPSVATSATLGGGLPSSAVPSLGSVHRLDAADFTPEALAIPDVSALIPTYVPVVTGLTIPEAPIYTIPATPAAPALNFTFDVPAAPLAAYGLPPSLFDLNLPSFTAPVLPVFNDTAPEFTTLPPSPFIQWTEPVYSSVVQDGIKTVLATMLAGGTGLPTAVERAIWERGREQESIATVDAVSDAMAQAASRGFSHPPGHLNAEVLRAHAGAQRKTNELSREVMVKQADLEQTNRNFAVEKGVSYEQVFTGLYTTIVDRNFQIAKFTVETTIQIYNMQIAAFNVAQSVFAQKTERVKVQLEIAFAGLKSFEAQVSAEKVKGEFNTQLQAQYDSKIKSFHEAVEAFKAIVMAATARSDLEKNKVELFKAQIESQVAEIGAVRGSFEAYSARVGGEVAKAGLEEANARVFSSRVQAWATQSEAGLKRAEVTVQNNHLKLDYAVANLNRATAQQGNQLAMVQANLAGYQASTARASAEFSATTAIKQAEVQAILELSRLSIAKYQALLEQWKTRSAEIIQLAGINADSLRAAGTIASNLASGAMAGTHVSAGVSAGASSSQARSDQKSEQFGFQQHLNDDASYTVRIERKGADVGQVPKNPTPAPTT